MGAVRGRRRADAGNRRRRVRRSPPAAVEAAHDPAPARVLRGRRAAAPLGHQPRLRPADPPPGRLARPLRHAPADGDRAQLHGRDAARAVPRLRRVAVPGVRLAQHVRLRRRGRRRRPRHPVAGRPRALGPRPTVRRAPQRHRDGDHRHRRPRRHHGVQPRRRAHARLRGRGADRARDTVPPARPRRGQAPRRRVRHPARTAAARAARARAAPLDARAQGRQPHQGVCGRHARARRRGRDHRLPRHRHRHQQTPARRGRAQGRARLLRRRHPHRGQPRDGPRPDGPHRALQPGMRAAHRHLAGRGARSDPDGVRRVGRGGGAHRPEVRDGDSGGLPLHAGGRVALGRRRAPADRVGEQLHRRRARRDHLHRRWPAPT